MRFSKTTSALAFAAAANAQTSTVPVTGLNGNASIISTNPVGTYYQATLPSGSGPQGYVGAVALTSGGPLTYYVSFSNLPAYGAPFIYHIHERPVAANGSCATTLAHQDPYKRGEVPICDAALPQTCQTGDLSGKHGNITSSAPFYAQYVDGYTSTDPNTNVFIGNLSITLHTFNKTRIACANFVQTTRPSGNVSVTAVPPTATATPSGPAQATRNAAIALGQSVQTWSGLAGLAAVMLAL